MFRLLLPLLIAALSGLSVPLTAIADAQPALFSTDGYRQTQYRSPTPATAEGAKTLRRWIRPPCRGCWRKPPI